MRKWLIALGIAAVLVLATNLTGFAATVSISASANTVYVGETVTITATTLKQGSNYTDSWSSGSGNTILDTDDYYVSTSTCSWDQPGTYTVSYSITMTAGKSGNEFSGSDSITITVLAKENEDEPTKQNHGKSEYAPGHNKNDNGVTPSPGHLKDDDGAPKAPGQHKDNGVTPTPGHQVKLG